MTIENEFNFDTESFDFDFDFSDLEESFALADKNRYCLPKYHKKIKSRAVLYDNAVKMADELTESIFNGATIYALLSGNFIFGDLIEALAVQNNLLFDDLTLSTLSISRDNVDSLENLIDGDYIRNLNIIVSDYFWSHNRQNAPYIYTALDKNDSFQLAVAGTHTKITLIKAGDKKIVITGSANFRSSGSIEEITIQTNPELYDFHKLWHDEILEEYGTIKKAIRRNKLFNLITKKAKGKLWPAR